MVSYVTTRGSRTRIPRLIYGTAWKTDRTADLVYQALQAGFRAIDTAAQPRHYREDLVAEGVRRALADGVVASRSDLYLQTKFTPPGGQDLEGPNAPPYDPSAPVAEQIRSSIESSLRNFTFKSKDAGKDESVSYLDCLVLHSALPRREDTVAAWQVLKTYVPHRIRTLGISNVYLEDLEEVFDVAQEVEKAEPAVGAASLCPVVVQNRFHRHRHHPDPYDVALRRFCAHPDRRVVYQSFWTLTANPDHLKSASIQAVAQGAQVGREVALYGMVALGLGGLDDNNSGGSASPETYAGKSGPVVVLDGTTTAAHMADDIAGIEKVKLWAESSVEARATWDAAVLEFRQRIRDI
ncbi:aldo-keto reductase [Ophiostoma piceae UAMH 11346]|uniref:Aldo-keto reductase n=1 Tax=Ophiostoma piceae (strain UAMH 11346) TaxID=1262450 RepID=S3C5K7_OPHP1|nr:aldo-keto reductase [Ophiostoma piceae UAMH 11346]